MNATIKPATIGSVSHATLRTDHLLSAFLGELEWQMARNGDYFSRHENFPLRDRLASLIGEAQDAFREDGEDVENEEIASELVGELAYALTEYFAPPYCYFGAHCGDGSDFGFWPSIESIQELPTAEDGEEESRSGDDCKTVTDHGNVTVWSGGKPILELV